MTRSISTILLLAMITPALAQDAEPNPKHIKTQLSDQVEDLLRAVRDGKTEVAAKIIEGWKPSQADLATVLNAEGVQALAAKTLETVGESLAGTPSEVAERLELDPAQLNVTVFAETTEGLESMEFGTIAALHFASALRRTTRFFKKRVTWYSVMMLEREAPEDATGSYLMLFFRSGEKFVYVGKIWSLDGSDEEGSDEDGSDEGGR